MKPATIIFAFIALSACNLFAATRDELAIQYTGPVKISPWRAAAESQSSPARDHYIYAPPMPFDYCGYGGFGCGYSSFSNYNYGFSNAFLLRGTSFSDYPR